MSSVDIFYLSLVLIVLTGFGITLAYFASQDLKMRKAREAEQATADARRPREAEGASREDGARRLTFPGTSAREFFARDRERTIDREG